MAQPPDTPGFPMPLRMVLTVIVIGALFWAAITVTISVLLSEPFVHDRPDRLTPQQQFERSAPPGAPVLRGLPW